MQKRLVLINVGVVIIGLIAAALLAMPLVRNLYLEEFHRTLDSAVMLLTTDGDEIQEDPEAFVQRKREALLCPLLYIHIRLMFYNGMEFLNFHDVQNRF